MHLSKSVFAQIKNVVGRTAISTIADDVSINGDSATIICLDGTLWINSIGTAVADSTCLELTEGTAIDLVVMGDLSLISDASGAEYQIIIWKT